VINFFGLRSSRSADHAGHLRAHGNIQFDVTDVVKQIEISGNAPPSLIFEPTTGLAESNTESAGQQMNRNANVRFESARLVKKR
jgi:hypothetical protein